MTPSQWLDIGLLGIAFMAAVSGWRSGAFVSLMSFAGVALGAVAGVLLAPRIADYVNDPRTRLFASLFLILSLAVIGDVAGVVLGRGVRGAIQSHAIRSIDSVIGVAVRLVVALVAAWLLATPLTSSDLPDLAAAVRGSTVLAEVNEIAPSWLKTVPKRLSALAHTSGWPAEQEPFSRTPIAEVAAPDTALADSPVVESTEPSVVKILAEAPSCQKVLEGTGFVVAPQRVMTNAHVVAGSGGVTVNAGGTSYDATVVSFDPKEDISILAVPNLAPPPLVFDDTPANMGTNALVLGYPGGGVFAASAARIREIIELSGPDIYQNATVNREVYTIRGNVQQGDSGGPMIDVNGHVLGVVFGAAVDDKDTGFVLTAKQVARQLANIGDTEPVSTEECVT